MVVARSPSHSMELGCAMPPQPVAVTGLERSCGSSTISKIGMQAPTGSATRLVQGAAILPELQVQDASRNYSIGKWAREGIVAIK